MDKLTKIAFIASLLGILIVIILSNQIEPKLTDIKNITNESLNKEVKIYGKISNIFNYEEKNFQKIIVKDDTGSIVVIANSKNPINKTNNEVLVIGKVERYDNDLQISAYKILEIRD